MNYNCSTKAAGPHREEPFGGRAAVSRSRVRAGHAGEEGAGA
jgi:hypothetical protein